MTENVIQTLKTARKVSTPIVAISTADAWACISAIGKAYDGERVPPMIQWDAARGFGAINTEGKAALAAIMPADTFPGTTPGLNLIEALTMATKLPQRSILVLLNIHRFFNEPAVLQGVLNLRELFKEDQRTALLLSPIIQLPLELQQDVMALDESLPTAETIRTVIEREIAYAMESNKTIEAPDAETLRLAVEASTGLAIFPVEQSVAMSLASTKRLDLDQMWARKRAYVTQTRGLKFDTGLETFADVGGLDAAKELAADIFGGRLPPKAIIRIDEIEKHMAGATGIVADSSGTSQDALGVILREMEDNAWRGMISVGPPGSGKSIFSKTLGRTHNVPTLELDLGALKGSLVGQSEENIRAAMKVIKAIAGDGAYFNATCNRLDALPPELRRRFTHGIYFFDLPTREELRPIWAINLKRFELADDINAALELSQGWTGAEVRNVCRLAYETRRTVAEMATRIVPVSVADPDSIERLRKLAAGKFLSASYPGPYRLPGTDTTTGGERRRFMES